MLYYRVPKKRGYTLAFFFCFDDPKDTFEFAYSYPYAYSDLQRFLGRKDHQALVGAAASPTIDYRRELLCRTPLHR